jgi:hypothetical protein
MHPLLRDLYYQQEWADTLHWKAFVSFPASLTDKKATRLRASGVEPPVTDF